ncbi:MAG TPA: hypothetical protein PKI93_03850 [Alphaproteobacteria bacterium]|nr:hypothetical protein [Alphaproteobacteria bacterium]HNS43817.1 hypothetical protein [Alphaproteobacteria bacterium]
MNISDKTKLFAAAVGLTTLTACQTLPQQGIVGQPPANSGVGTAVQNGTAQIGDAFQRAIDPRQYGNTATNAVEWAARRKYGETVQKTDIGVRAEIEKKKSDWLGRLREAVSPR